MTARYIDVEPTSAAARWFMTSGPNPRSPTWCSTVALTATFAEVSMQVDRTQDTTPRSPLMPVPAASGPVG